MNAAFKAVATTIVANENGLPLPAVLDVLDGLFFRTLNVNHLDKLKLCILDGTILGEDIMLAVDDFKLKDLNHILEGLKELGIALQSLESDY